MKSIRSVLKSRKGKEKHRSTDPNRPNPASPEAFERTHKYGLFLLNPLSSPFKNANVGDEYSVDIVAVHGITGDALNTWTDGNGKLWLRDFLPNDLPGIRVFSFGYPAEVFCSLGTGNFDTYSRALLEALKGQRRGDEVWSFS